jgi:hypothetical protein
MNITLMMKVVSSSAMSVIAYRTTQWNIPEDSHLHKGYCLKMGLKEEKSQNHSPSSSSSSLFAFNKSSSGLSQTAGCRNSQYR